jgi:tetratricopeptide (TPR) repeat protein
LLLPEWHWHALACLKAGDGTGYRRVCTRLAEGVGAAPPAEIANAVAWVCAVGPDGLGDYAQVLALAEEALNKCQAGERGRVLNTLGGVLYRAGRYREAVARLREGVEAGGGEGTLLDWALLAMAHQRLGEAEEARKYLANVVRRTEKEGGDLWAGVEAELLRQEAEVVVGGRRE